MALIVRNPSASREVWSSILLKYARTEWTEVAYEKLKFFSFERFMRHFHNMTSK